jgi:hypothetical protein
MERNLYSPPAAPVADPVETEEAMGERPAEVTWALRLLWASLVLGGIELLQQRFLRVSLVFVLLTSGIPYVIVGWLLYKIHRGRHWARVTYLVLWLFGIAYVLLFWRVYAAYFDGKHSMAAGTRVAETLLDAVGSVLLFVPAANRWFRPRIGVS